MRKKGRVCLLFSKKPEGTHYKKGAYSWVPEAEAEGYINDGYAEEYNPNKTVSKTSASNNKSSKKTASKTANKTEEKDKKEG